MTERAQIREIHITARRRHGNHSKVTPLLETVRA